MPSEYVEKVVCNDEDIKDNEMKQYDLDDESKILLIRQNGELSAIGSKCSHYGAPLSTGALGEGRIRMIKSKIKILNCFCIFCRSRTLSLAWSLLQY